MIPFAAIEQLRKVAKNLHEIGDTSNALALAVAISDVVQATENPDFYAAAPYGVCPHCGDYEELLRVDKKNYAICHEHRVYWYIGAFSPVTQIDISKIVDQLPNLIRGYTQIAINEIFPTSVCPCCGLFRHHAPWCITPLPDRQGLDSELLSAG